MNRRFLVPAGLALVGGVLAIGLLRWYVQREATPDLTDREFSDAVLKHIGPPPVQTAHIAALDMSQKIRLGIGSLGFSDDEQNRAVADLVTSPLSDAPGLELVERQSLDQVLRELQLGLAGFVRAKDALAVGKLLRADWFLLGTKFALGGTNSIVLRIVDARTGILRDAGVIPAEGPPTQVSANIAAFVKVARQTAARAQPRVYLAIGTFEDLSPNNRRADFPAQLRGSLMAEYRRSNVTLLEREYVEALLQEVRLDLAGLTEASTNAPQPVQSAFWLVTGQYQSYEAADLQVELLLNVQHIFGHSKRLSLRGLPDTLAPQVKSAIDASLKNNELLIPTRKSEARAQIEIGQDIEEGLIRIGPYAGSEDLIYNDFGSGMEQWEALQRHDPSVARRARNLNEAIRAFRTVLLLEPTNREAKIRLAICLRDPTIGQLDEALHCYREVIELGPQDKWSEVAQRALLTTFERQGDVARAAVWFRAAAAQVIDQAVANFYRRQAESAEAALTLQRGDVESDAKTGRLAEQRLFESIQAFRSMELLGIPATNRTFADASAYRMGMFDYVKLFGDQKTKAAQKLVELLPKMKSLAPDLEPYLLAAVVSFQVDPQPSMLGDFEHSLDSVIAHPDQVLNVRKFWEHIRWEVGDWCFEKTNYDLALKIFQGERRAGAEGHAEFNDDEKIKLAYACLGTQRWQEALDIFQTFSNQSVSAPGSRGPWGRARTMIRTDNLANYCRQKLGLALSLEPRQFEMESNCLCMHTPSAFVADLDGLWLAISGQLLRLDFDLNTNRTASLPIAADVPIRLLLMGRDKLWIGTDGAGLIECDRAELQSRRLTVADGLISDSIADVFEAGDQLWIRYGPEAGGGVTRLELRSRKTKSFMRSLIDSRTGLPPRVPGSSWGPAPNKNGENPFCFAEDQNRWVEGVEIAQTEIEVETQPSPGSASQSMRKKFILTDDELSDLWADIKTNPNGRRITATQAVNPKPAIEVYNIQEAGWHTIIDAAAIPHRPTALTLSGKEVWAGGEGFIVRVNLAQNKVLNFCRIKADSVERIQLGGGYIWAQFDKHLHRARVP